MNMKITSQQCRAARAFLGISQSEAASGMGISEIGLRKFESDEPVDTRISTYEKMCRFFDNRNIQFTENGGVEPRPYQYIRTLKGINAMSDFLDDVYETSVKHGTKENPTPVYLSNVVHTNWVKWMGADLWENHRKRMTKDRDLMDVRIITKEGDPNFLTLKYSKYKWMKEQYFNDKSFYSYHDRLAFLDFEENDLVVNIMFQADFAKGYRDLFLMVWDNLAIDPPKELLEKALKEQG